MSLAKTLKTSASSPACSSDRRGRACRAGFGGQQEAAVRRFILITLICVIAGVKGSLVQSFPGLATERSTGTLKEGVVTVTGLGAADPGDSTYCG